MPLLSAAAVGLLADAADRLAAGGGGLALRNPCGLVGRVLQILDLAYLLRAAPGPALPPLRERIA